LCIAHDTRCAWSRCWADLMVPYPLPWVNPVHIQQFCDFCTFFQNLRMRSGVRTNLRGVLGGLEQTKGTPGILLGWPFGGHFETWENRLPRASFSLALGSISIISQISQRNILLEAGVVKTLVLRPRIVV